MKKLISLFALLLVFAGVVSAHKKTITYDHKMKIYYIETLWGDNQATDYHIHNEDGVDTVCIAGDSTHAPDCEPEIRSSGPYAVLEDGSYGDWATLIREQK